MGRPFIVFSFHCLFALKAWVQAPTLNWGQGIGFSRNESLHSIFPISDLEAGWVRLKFPPLGYHKAIVDVFDLPYLHLDRSIELHHGKTVQERYRFYRPKFAGMTVLSDRFLIFQTGYDPNRKQALALINPIDLNGREEGKPHLILDERVESKIKAPTVRFLSEARTGKIALFTTNSSDRQLGVELEISVFDSTMNLDWTNSVLLPYQRNELGEEDIKIDESGTVWSLLQIRPKNIGILENREDKSFLQLMVFSSRDSLGEFFSLPLVYGERKVRSASLDTVQGQIWISMSYEISKKKTASISGIFLQPLPKDPRISWPEPIDLAFEPSFLPDFETDALIQSRADRDAAYIEVLKVFSSYRGSKFVLAEHRLFTEHCYTDYRTAQQFCTYTYYRNDLFVFALDSMNQIEWKMKLPKRQVSRNDQGMFLSVLPTVYNDTLKLAWLDHPENIDLKTEKERRFMDNPRKANLLLWRLPLRGVPSRTQTPLPRQGKKVIVPMLNKGLPLRDGSVFFPGILGRKMYPGILNW